MIIHFLSGLPRSGSTVLSSLLNQHPQVHSTTTSGLVEIMGAVCKTWESSPTTIAQGSDRTEAHRMLRSVMQSKYDGVDKPVVIDKSRAWVNPAIMKTMTDVLGRPPKIIATVRSTADCAASFIRIAKPSDVSTFLRSSPLIQHLKSSYMLLKMGFEAAPENILFIDYDDLMNNPQQEMNRIHEFLSLEPFEYNFQDIDPSVVAEKDDVAWGIPNLHSISPRLGYQHNQNSKEILAENFDMFDQLKFWKSDNGGFVKKKLDIAVELSAEGNFEESHRVLCEAQQDNPLCNKIAFNMGWHDLRHNRLQQGMQNLARGRYENCFGDPKPSVPTQIWDGKSKGTILYYLEGSIVDQIHALKYIGDLNRRGCDVIVACSAELFPLVKSCSGTKMLVEHAAAGGVYHDYWVPSMSVLLPLGYEYADIRGNPYIPKTKCTKNKRPVIGVSCGDDFPNDMLFEAVIGTEVDADFIYLHGGTCEKSLPEFVKKVPLNNWQQIREEMSKCDLLISSCTGVAVLSAAMGIPTWILVPMSNHPIWSVSGGKTPYYDSVDLYRQEKVNCWEQPITQLKYALQERLAKKKINWSNLWQSILG